MVHALTRRTVIAAVAAICAPARIFAAAEPKRLTLELSSRDLALRPGQPPISTAQFSPADALRFAQGDQVEVVTSNRLPVEAFIHWRGLDAAASLEPLLARPAIPPGGTTTYPLMLAHAGTMTCEAWLGSGHAAVPSLPVVVAEKIPPEIDRDLTLLIESWRPEAGEPIYTLNGQSSSLFAANLNERLRLRFINSTQQTVIAIQLSGADVRVVALDGQPAEPFLARDGRLVMAAGTRIDAIIDVAGPGPCGITLNDGSRSMALGEIKVTGTPKRPQPLAEMVALPSNGLPAQLALQAALRVDIPLDARAPWATFPAITATTPPAFRVKRGRPVVLALANPSDATAVFHLHGHHMRLLDRLDDGWKPFWLDTIAVPAKQTVRVAFGATNPGLYLMEMRGAADRPRLLRSYLVEM